MFAGALGLLSVLFRDHMGAAGFWLGNLLIDVFGRTSFLVVALCGMAGLWLFSGEGLKGRLRGLLGGVMWIMGISLALGALGAEGGRFWAGELGLGAAQYTRAWVGLPGLALVAASLAGGGLWLNRAGPLVRGPVRFCLWSFPRIPGLLQAGWLGSRRWLSSQRLTARALRAHATTSFTASGVAPLGAPAAAPVAKAQRSEQQAAGTEKEIFAGSPARPRARITREKKEEREPRSVPSSPLDVRHWKLPPASILSGESAQVDASRLRAFISDQSQVIEKTLAAFRVEGRIVSVTPAARVILFEWQPAPGVKASRLEQLADDLALAMKVERVRVVLPLPGKGTIGIEIPHPSPAMVTLGGLIGELGTPPEGTDLPLFLGKALTGEPLMCDLVQLPHLLIAGTTGSGKSVCIHGVLISLLMNRTPDNLRLILIDPKRVEMIGYSGLPHLQFEVISDARKAVSALRWLVDVMDARYRLLARYGCRNLNVFNGQFAEDEMDIEAGEREGAVLSASGLPWIVVAVDELADLMVTRPREVEDALQRIAQMARGVGIHLVVATQRPSVDVVTGVIKANLPSRISFQVATRVDSRTILDSGGGEQLLGRGDMLFSPAGSAGPQRAQAAFVSSAEVGSVLEHWTEQGTGQTAGPPPEAASGALEDESDADDPLYDEAVNMVTKTGEASVSMLQRRLSIGFARAGRLIDIMERNGVVGPKQGSKAREILIRETAESAEGGET